MIMIAILSALVVASVPAGYKLVFKDEFNYKGLPDAKKWTAETGYLRNNEKQNYPEARTEYARVDGKVSTIEARKDHFEGKPITSACLNTSKNFSFTYGYVEVRAKVPGGRGTWPAAWMLAKDIDKKGWPLCGEIDIIEYVGYEPDNVHFNAHTQAYNHTIGTNKGTHVVVPNFKDEFHTFGLLWTPDKLVWELDGKKVFEFSKESADPTKWPFDTPQYLILNLAIGGDWGGQKGIDDAIFPAKYLVDYVRVYQKTK